MAINLLERSKFNVDVEGMGCPNPDETSLLIIEGVMIDRFTVTTDSRECVLDESSLRVLSKVVLGAIDKVIENSVTA